MNEVLTFYLICVAVACVMGFFMLKYLNGDYSFKDEVYKENNINYCSSQKVFYQSITIKRTYDNGKIVFKEIIRWC